MHVHPRKQSVPQIRTHMYNLSLWTYQYRRLVRVRSVKHLIVSVAVTAQMLHVKQFSSGTTRRCLLQSHLSHHAPCMCSGLDYCLVPKCPEWSRPTSATMKVRSFSPGWAEPPATCFMLTVLPCIMFWSQPQQQTLQWKGSTSQRSGLR